MAIVRELLVRIGFITDKRAINATNNAITGFRTRFALAATAATYALSKITGFFGDIAQASLQAQGLAATLGLSIEELNAINKGFKKFDFNDSQIETVLTTLNEKFTDFRIGASDEIGKVAAGLTFEVDRNAGPLKFFRDYLIELGKVQDETQRIKLATTLFGNQVAPLISNLSQNVGGLDEAITKAFKANPDLKESTEALKEYRQAINEISDAWSNLSLALSKTVVPVFTNILNILSSISEIYRGLFTFNAPVLKAGLEQGSKIFDPLFKETGLSYISDFFKELAKRYSINLNNQDQNDPYGFNNSSRFLNPFAATNDMAVTNNVEINVPPGTNAQQAESLTDYVLNAIYDGVMNVFRQIQNNNPQVE